MYQEHADRQRPVVLRACARVHQARPIYRPQPWQNGQIAVMERHPSLADWTMYSFLGHKNFNTNAHKMDQSRDMEQGDTCIKHPYVIELSFRSRPAKQKDFLPHCRQRVPQSRRGRITLPRQRDLNPHQRFCNNERSFRFSDPITEGFYLNQDSTRPHRIRAVHRPNPRQRHRVSDERTRLIRS